MLTEEYIQNMQIRIINSKNRKNTGVRVTAKKVPVPVLPTWYSFPIDFDLTIITSLKNKSKLKRPNLKTEFIYLDKNHTSGSINSSSAKIIINGKREIVESYNEAIKYSTGKYVLFIDNNFESNNFEWVERAVTENVDIATPTVLNKDKFKIYGANSNFELNFDQTNVADYPLGMCFLISKKLLLKIEGFNNDYINAEPADLISNLRLRGHKLNVFDSDVIWNESPIIDPKNKTLFYQRWIETGLLNGTHKKNKLNIFTPSIRENNLPILGKYIDEYNMNIFDLTWYIVMDYNNDCPLQDVNLDKLNKSWIKIFKYQEEGSRKGIAQCNYALDQIEDGYVWGIADDCIPHPNFFLRMHQIMHKTPNKGVYIVNQRRSNGRILEARENNVKPGKIDGAQAVIKRNIYGNNRFIMHNCTDGVMYKMLFEEFPKEFVFTDEILSYFEVFPDE